MGRVGQPLGFSPACNCKMLFLSTSIATVTGATTRCLWRRRCHRRLAMWCPLLPLRPTRQGKGADQRLHSAPQGEIRAPRPVPSCAPYSLRPRSGLDARVTLHNVRPIWSQCSAIHLYSIHILLNWSSSILLIQEADHQFCIHLVHLYFASWMSIQYTDQQMLQTQQPHISNGSTKHTRE